MSRRGRRDHDYEDDWFESASERYSDIPDRYHDHFAEPDPFPDNESGSAGDWGDSGELPLGGRELARVDDQEREVDTYRPAVAPVVIPGSGVSMGNPFIKRRERPLTLRLAVAALIVSIVVSGLFSLTPLGSSATTEASAFDALSSAVVVHGAPGYHIYVAKWGDDLQSVAEKFGVQIGGIIELNNIPIGQELQVGRAYKIPDDPYYGQNYRPTYPYTPSGNGMSRLATYDWWTAYAGTPLPEAPCAPNGGSNPLGYDLRSPLWNSSWVRGFTWYHNGVDISNGFGHRIRAAQYGEVLWAGWTNTGFGFSVVIDHCHHLETLYGHMSKLLVKEGDIVAPGTVLGLEGATGWATGPHLHLSVLYYGQFVNPMDYFPSVYALTHGP